MSTQMSYSRNGTVFVIGKHWTYMTLVFSRILNKNDDLHNRGLKPRALRYLF